MKDRYTRLNELEYLLRVYGDNYSIANLAVKYDVSEMTIRRDLKYIKQGALSEPQNVARHLFNNDPVSADNYEYKDLIAKKAASLIEPDDVIIIDSGSTTCLIPQYLDPSMRISALCYNYQILSQLYDKEHVSLIFAGGYFHRDNQMFESPDGLNLIQHTRANKLFISASGIHKTLGMTCFHSYEVVTKHAVLDSAFEKILVADSTKFGKIRSNFYAPLNCVDTIITDNRLSEQWKEYIEELNIKLILV